MSKKKKQVQPEFIKDFAYQQQDLYRFGHEAMATIYEVLIAGEEEKYAKQAAQAVFDEIDLIEAQLSKFIENSDISKINKLKAEEPIILGLASFECLAEGKRMFLDTEGAFDITVGMLVDCWLDKNKTLRNPSKAELEKAKEHTGSELFVLNEQEHSFMLLMSPLRIDPGGIGKGYAVDKAVELLDEWGIETALVHGGYSSIYARGSLSAGEGWPITFSKPGGKGEVFEKVFLKDAGLGCSGLQKGSHIIDPRNGEPVKGKKASWVTADKAVTCDGLSTAVMIMDEGQIEQYVQKYASTGVMLLESGDKDKIKRFGVWG